MFSEKLFWGNKLNLAISNQPLPGLRVKESLPIQKHRDFFNCEHDHLATQISKRVMFQLRQRLNSASYISGTELN